MDKGGNESETEELGEEELERFENALGEKVDEVAVGAKPVHLVLTKVSCQRLTPGTDANCRN